MDDTKDNDKIILKGIRVNNLKNIDVEIPRNQLIVITGLSGSGKSSLVFDTIYAEGQRRYIESLSSYIRQFLGKVQKPNIEMVKGIPPAIAIEQKVGSRNTRSTVGTVTEMYEYIKLLYARVGRTYSPVSSKEVRRESVEDVFDFIFSLDENLRLIILAPFSATPERTIQQHLELFMHQGFSRIYLDNKIVPISDCLQKEFSENDTLYLLVDRCTLKKEEENKSRLNDSIEAAYFEGNGHCRVIVFNQNEEVGRYDFSNRFEEDNIIFRKPSVNMFTFTNSYGACSVCNGLGEIVGIDPDLVIPDKSLSIYDDAVAIWRGDKMGEYKYEILKNAYKFNFPIYKPIKDLSKKEYDLLWTGNKYFSGLNKFVRWLEENSYKIQYRVLLSRYKGKTVCPECNGSRLAKDVDYVKIGGKSITETIALSIKEALSFFESLKFDTEEETIIASLLLEEITTRMKYLSDLGLSYLTLNRSVATLSGGEYQRVNLAASLGSNLVGSLYILDEPSIGLHTADTHLLITLLKHLRDIGNTVIVVEHDEEIIRAADYIIDMGPFAGQHGGEIVFKGSFEQMLNEENSITAQYMNGIKKIEIPEKRREAKHSIMLKDATLHNLKQINVEIPLGVFTVVTGVSGSGKSSLIKDILYPELKHIKENPFLTQDGSLKLSGDVKWIDSVEFVDQNPIGRSARSNPATYIGAFEYIRQLYAEQPLAQTRSYKPGFFSLNMEGGRCETCQGEGKIKVGMQFMSDVEITCDECKGKRYKDEVLDIKIKDKSIIDILNLPIEEVVDFISTLPDTRLSKHIIHNLKPLQDVGLGYLQLGQSSSTLSGGEAQRVKLAFFLSRFSETKRTMFIFDEPTTGLHYYDIHKLYNIFNLLVDHGHTVIVVEHNLELIKCADWIIDLGPKG
ncbi:MAG: excinuclease ABC subunit UvrA, partial [Bacteroidales bacterium]|nr:excinuclease ABC subunit UvrA [Bacteroidales bacterium]